MCKKFITMIIAACLCLVWATFSQAAEVVIVNGSYEEEPVDNIIPGWPAPFGAGVVGQNITISTAPVFHGKQSIRLEDDSSTQSIGLRSAPIPAVPGRNYIASAYAYLESGTAQLYLEFWDDNNQRLTYTIGSGGGNRSWALISTSGTAPKDASYITLLIYSHIANTGVAYYDKVSLELEEEMTVTEAVKQGIIQGIPPVKFDLSKATFEVPSLEEMRQTIPDTHPRLFVRPETLDELRNKHKKSPLISLVWKNITVKALTATTGVLPKEPPDARPGGVFDVVAWRAGITIANQIVNDLDALGFAYLISGDQRYGEAGKKLLMHVVGWDPNGTSSRSKNDEISMRLLYSLSRAYDWLYPLLSEEERAKVQECMRIRGNDVYLTMRRGNFETKLLDNHLVRTMGFMGQAAIAFMGEIPEAEVWFDYIVSLYILEYPKFGNDEGGWSQGVSYWQSYISWCLDFLDAFKIATGVDLYQKPFFRNTGYFKLYAHPPKSQWGAFGDHSDEKPSDSSAQVVQRFALNYKDPALQWYASQITGMGRVPALPTNTFVGYLNMPATAADLIDPELPPDFPQSKYFSDVGWVLMNVDMTDWDNNVHVKFKSSPYGSFNHSHAEQNSFIIEAYGSPLAINSGYYPWYGSPHHATWTWESRSKNTILINGQGQGVQNINAKGKILDTSLSSHFDYVLGDATEAYMGRLKGFQRHLWFIKPNVIAIYDELSAAGPATYDWLLHSLKQMEVNDEDGYVRVPGDTAEMWVSFITPAELEFSLTDQFTVPPEDRDAGKPNQWHLTAKAQSADGNQRFFTILVPRPAAEADQAPPLAKATEATNGCGATVTVGGKEITIAFRDSSAERLEVDGFSTDAVAIAIWREVDGTKSGVMAVNATSISRQGEVLFSSESQADGAWDLVDGRLVVAAAK